MELDAKLRDMAITLEDREMLARISGGGLVAIEAKQHHRKCQVNYRNAFKRAQRARDRQYSSCEMLLQALIFAEIVSHIENHVTNGAFIFKLSELHTLYENHLKDAELKKKINKTRFIEQILDIFGEDCQ